MGFFYSKVNWENGEVSQDGYVEIDGTQYPLTMPQYTGSTPIDATNLNHMDTAIEELAKVFDDWFYLLYNGTWSSGTVSVSYKYTDYNTYYVYTNDGIIIPCIQDYDNNLYGSISVFNGSDINTYIFQATYVPNNQLSLVGCKKIVNFNKTNATDLTVNRIYGIFKGANVIIR